METVDLILGIVLCVAGWSVFQAMRADRRRPPVSPNRGDDHPPAAEASSATGWLRQALVPFLIGLGVIASFLWLSGSFRSGEKHEADANTGGTAHEGIVAAPATEATTTTTIPVSRAMMIVCNGGGVPEAAPPGENAPHPVVLLGPRPPPDPDPLPPGWVPETIGSTEFVACIAERRAVVEECKYQLPFPLIGAFTVERRRIDWEVGYVRHRPERSSA